MRSGKSYHHEHLSIVAVITLIGMTALLWHGHQLSAVSLTFDSPVPTPSTPAPPVPTVAPLPKCHAIAIAYMARQHGIPEKDLIVGSYVLANGEYRSYAEEEWIEFPFTGRKACLAKVDVKGSGPLETMAIDGQGQVIDLTTLEKAERAAAQARCGKLNAALCERLPALAPGERVEVAIWLTDIDRAAIYDDVAASYPPSLQIAKGLPFDIGHPDYQHAFRQVEARMVSAYQDKAATVMAFLASQDAPPIYASTSAPVIFTEITKPVIMALAERSDVSHLYLLGGGMNPSLDSAVPTDRVGRFWSSNYLGDGIRVAIVEDNPVDFGNPYLDHANGGTCDAAPAEPNDPRHPNLVAGVVAMDGHPSRRGVAPHATLISADAGAFSPERYIAVASDCAINTYQTDVLNASFAGYGSAEELWSRYFDHVVWSGRRVVTAAAGNEAQQQLPVAHPAQGYNVLGVGGTLDNDTGDWSDDVMWPNSNYINPGARQKPDVTAVGGLCSVDDNDCRTGTSMAAPQVAGLAALLMEQTGLTRVPEAIRAIIMASAAHNIEGEPRLSDRDGAGAIDGNLAYKIAAQGRYNVTAEPGYDYRTITNASFDGFGNLHYYVPASRGEKVRVVLVYDSQPDATDPYSSDYLRADLDLVVVEPAGGTVAGASTLAGNSYEIVEFTAGATGTYDVRVHRFWWDPNTPFEYIGIAWVKDATYLPDLAHEAAGALHPWVSELYIRNEAPVGRDVLIYYHENQGVPTPKGSDLCSLAPNQWCVIPMDEASNDLYRIRPGQRGSATVSGGEDVTVIVMNTHQAAPYTADSYTGIAQTSPALRAPLIFRNNYSWQTDFTVYNPHSQADAIQVIYDAWSGTGCTTGWLNVPANGNYNVNQLGWPSCTLSSPFVGGARVVSQSGRPLAGVAFQWNWVNSAEVSRMSYELFAAGSSPAYAPLVMRNNYGFNTGIGFQDMSGNAGNLALNYYQQNGSVCGVSGPYYVGANGAYPIHPLPPNGVCVPAGAYYVGGAQATRDASLAFGGVVNQVQSGTNTAMSYDMPPRGAHAVIVPLVMRDRDNWRGKNDWSTGFAIQNTGEDTAVVNIRYFAQGGQLASASPISVAAHGVAIVNPAPGNISPFLGSAVITANQPVAVMVNYASAGTDDHGMSIAGVHR